MRTSAAGAAAALILSTAAAITQTPAIVHILSDDSQLLVGRTLAMYAVVRDSG